MHDDVVRRITCLDVWHAVKHLVGPEVPEEWRERFEAQWRRLAVREAVELDADALIQWIVAGVSLFSIGDPLTIRRVDTAVDSSVFRVLVNRHAGNITHMAESLQLSRRAVRERLKKAGLYERALALRRGIVSASVEAEASFHFL